MNLEFPADLAAFHVMPSIRFQEASEEQGGSSRKRTTFGPSDWETYFAEFKRALYVDGESKFDGY
jgi:hypothetical protein